MKSERYHANNEYSLLPRIITSVTEERMNIFSLPQFAQATFDQVHWSAQHWNVRLHAFVIMPNHIHIIAQYNGHGTITKFMQSIKRQVSRDIGIWHDEIHHTPITRILNRSVWQESFNQLLIYGKESFEHRIRYIANNPVKEYLVKQWNEYSWTYIAPEHQTLMPPSKFEKAAISLPQ